MGQNAQKLLANSVGVALPDVLAGFRGWENGKGGEKMRGLNQVWQLILCKLLFGKELSASVVVW